MQNITVTAHNQGTHEIYICNETNQPYANLAQLERMFPGTSNGTLRNRLQGVQPELVKTAKIQTAGGIQGVQLYPASVVFDLAIEFDPTLAKQMGAAGAAVYMYGIAGYEVRPTAKVEADRQHLEASAAPKPKLSEIKQATKMYESRYGKAYGDRYHDQMMAKHYPALVGAQAAPEEKAPLPTAKALLNPTQIAERLGWWCKSNASKGDARKVNQQLAFLGYQEQIASQWSATTKAVTANLADRVPVNTGSKTQKDQLRWSADIVAILQEHTVSA